MEMTKGKSLTGHLVALATVSVWGVTFAASKELLTVCRPVQLMILRFALGYLTLFAMRPELHRPVWREEWFFCLMGVFGCSLYFLMENSALTLTYASNVSILVATAPIFTALLAGLLVRGQSYGRWLWPGFLAALAGVALVVFNGTVKLHLSPAGDLMSLGAAVCWGVYAVLQEKGLRRYDSLFLARKVAFYGLLTAVPLLALDGAWVFPLRTILASPLLLGCLLFLGVIGSGVTYFAWAWAQRRLGVIVTNNYIFAIPFVTLAASALFLREPFSWMGVLGSVLIVSGVALADRR